MKTAITSKASKLAGNSWNFRLQLIISSLILFVPVVGMCATYGITDPPGTFVPKVTVTVGNKEVLIKKITPSDKFSSISLILNKKNRALVRNVGLLNIQWINQQNRPGRPLPFAGPHYDPTTLVYKDSMVKSAAIRIIDKSTRGLFTGKEFSDLFTLTIEGKRCVSSESFYEKDRTVKLDSGRDLSIDVDKNSVVFNEDNFKKGEIVNVDNRSGYNQTLGVKLPQKGLLYYQIIRKPEQTKVPRENWDRFSVEADSGIFIVLIPEPDPAHLAELEGTEITINVWDGNHVRETRKIPIKISPELRLAQKEETLPAGTATEGELQSPGTSTPLAEQPGSREEAASSETQHAPSASESVSSSAQYSGGIWIWALLILNLALLIALGVYWIFFMLPKMQVLEDRLAKNEMFIHGSREAIREEIEAMKEDVLRECRPESSSE